MEARRRTKVRVRSQSSHDSSSSLLEPEPEPTADLDSLDEKCISTEWTNEKHSLYLKSMEASFVNQLHNSKNLLGWPPQKAKQKPFRGLNCNTCRISGEFKVFRDGRWQKISCGIAEPPRKLDDSSVVLVNPWIQHFRSTSKHQDVANQIVQVSAASLTPEIEYRGKKVLSSGLATSSKQSHGCHSHLKDQDFTEVSDQNFDGEINEGNIESRIVSSKRMKTRITDSSSSDQVVPCSSSPVTEQTSGNHART